MKIYIKILCLSKIQFLLFLFITIFTIQSYGQIFTGLSIRGEKNVELNSKFNNYELFYLNTSLINNYVNDNNFNYQIQLVFGDKNWILELFPNDIRKGDFIHTVGLENQETILQRQPNFSFIGHLKNGGNQKAIFTIMNEFIMGYIQDGGEEYFIEKANYLDESMPESVYIVYKSSDVIYNPEMKCGYDIFELQKKDVDKKRKEELRKETKNQVGKRGDCWELEVALACDWAYVSKHGGNEAAEGFMFGILNLVSFNWDDEFADEIEIVGSTAYSSPCANCDPWSGTTDLKTLLLEFANWGNGGGFKDGEYDIATLWSDRELNRGSDGGIWLNGICDSSRYNCCHDFTSGTNTLRHLQSHQIGHNFGLPHVSGPFIMAPIVNGSDTWSKSSIGWVDSITPFECMSKCVGISAPNAEFSSNIQKLCLPGLVEFEDISSNNPVNWLWEFEGGFPNRSRSQHPSVNYSKKGSYKVSLKASNAGGSDVKISFDYIVVLDVPKAIFSYKIDTNEMDKISFFDESVDPVVWEWNFGDGNTSSEENPIHVYEMNGKYNVTLKVTNECGSNTFIKEVIVTTVSIKENDFVYSLTIAPNPTKGQFNIDVVGKAYNEMNIEVISIIGKKVWSSIENFSTGSLSLSINVENVSNGTYFVVLRSKDKVSVRKIVIQH